MFTYNYEKDTLNAVAMDVSVRNAARTYHVADHTFLSLNNTGEMKLIEEVRGFRRGNYIALATV